MTNIVRGEYTANIHGREYTFCVTLGAMAEIEAGLGADLSSLGEVLARPSMSQITTILMALLRGGGEDITHEDLLKWPMSASGLTEIITKTFAASGLGEDKEKGNEAPEEMATH